MPHADKDFLPQNDTMGETLTNGEKHSSLFISHLTSYPLVSDSLSFYLENPYGAKSVNLVNDAYNKFLVPVEPYFKTPYSYVAPYVAKADSLGDKGLSEVDTRFPIVKEDASTLKEKAKGLPLVPYLFQGKDYVFTTYESESKKNGDGIVPFAKSIIGTEIRIASDTLAYVSSFLTQKKKEGKEKAGPKIDEGKAFTESKINEFKEKTNA